MSIINILVTNQANAATQLSFARTLKWCKPRKTESSIYVGKSINSLVPSGSISEYGFKLAMWPSQIFSLMVASVINKIHCRTIPHFMWSEMQTLEVHHSTAVVSSSLDLCRLHFLASWSRCSLHVFTFSCSRVAGSPSLVSTNAAANLEDFLSFDCSTV
jgi:hypothetical protein